MVQSSFYEQERQRRQEELERMERLQRAKEQERARHLSADLAAGAMLGAAGGEPLDENEGDGVPWQEDFGALAPGDEDERQERLDTSRAKDYAEKKLKERYAERKAAKKAGEEAAKTVGRALTGAGAGGEAAAGATAGAPVLVVVLVIIGVILAIILMLFLFVGSLVYTCNKSWTARATSKVGSWVGIIPEDICKSFLVDKGGGGVDADDPDSGQAGSFCPRTEWAFLAATYKTPVSPQNSPELNRLISCITSDPRLEGQDLGTVYTFEQSNPACNLVRGLSYCGRCAHTVYSCHYGGKNGSQGSEAVDFGLGSGYNAALFDLVESVAKDCGAGFVLDETDHIHISTVNCDRDAENYSHEGNIET